MNTQAEITKVLLSSVGICGRLGLGPFVVLNLKESDPKSSVRTSLMTSGLDHRQQSHYYESHYLSVYLDYSWLSQEEKIDRLVVKKCQLIEGATGKKVNKQLPFIFVHVSLHKQICVHKINSWAKESATGGQPSTLWRAITHFHNLDYQAGIAWWIEMLTSVESSQSFWLQGENSRVARKPNNTLLLAPLTVESIGPTCLLNESVLFAEGQLGSFREVGVDIYTHQQVVCHHSYRGR